MHKFRTHNCGELSLKHLGSTVKLSGWVHRMRDHGNLIFIDLRDHYGITQCVVNIEGDLLSELSSISNESVLTITGKIVARSDETVNKNIDTGTIEVLIEEFIVESKAEVLPLFVNSNQEFPEETRLKYRFLDLRREKLHNNIILRSNVIAFIRNKMHMAGFLEFQTPILTASSPEGARDYLVASRVHPGKFYALPQSPQQFKQLLMISGFDKYFQISPCFRDEDGRADRSPGEFYQLDVEMSYVTQDDVFETMGPIIYSVFKEFSDKKIAEYPFPKITYHDSMLKYGNDKPDLRNPIEICDAADIFRDSEFTIFKENLKKNFVIRAIPAPNTAIKPRSFFDKVANFATENGAKGLGYITWDIDGNAKGPIVKFLSTEQLDNLKNIAKLNNGDSVFFVSDIENEAAKLSGKIRTFLGNELELIDKDSFKFCWIIDFPFYEWNEDKKNIDFTHNPFSMPQGGLDALNAADTTEKLLKILAYQYDIVCNGIELSSGGIRNHKPELMYRAFELVGYSKEEVDNQFGGMIRAFKYGAPPHGGIAPGVDRIVMLLADEPNIREVIAFPMNQQAQDLLMGAPSYVDTKQLRELNIDLSESVKKSLKAK